MSAKASRAAGPEAPTVGVASDYEAVVAALFARRPEWLVPGLRRIRHLVRRLDAPQRAYATLHVAGTNGKSSTARIATSVLLAAGRTVGTFISPHLQDVRERILINDKPVDRATFLRVMEGLRDPIAVTEDELGEMVTFFETLTALGALCFRQAHVDVGVIEVGKGGRWDATNIHHGQVAVIGPVGLDHPELGASVGEVAAQKAGVLKEGSVGVVGLQLPTADAVISSEASARGAQLLRLGTAFEILSRRPVPGGQDLVLRIGRHVHAGHLPLHGGHQAANAACAVAAVDALLADEGGLSPEAVRTGLSNARSPGRFEVMTRRDGPPVVLDGAHNGDGARSLVDAVREALPGRRVVVVLGVLSDKDVQRVVDTMAEIADALVVTRPPCARSASPSALASAIRGRGGRAVRADTAAGALGAADRLAAEGDVIVVTGSLYLVGAVRGLLGGEVA